MDGYYCPPLRCHVSSDYRKLEELHNKTGWTPGQDSIRPTDEMRAQKDLWLASLTNSSWATIADYVLYSVFGAACTRDETGKRRAVSVPLEARPVLQEQRFPYNVPSNCCHLVLWCPSGKSNWNEETITKALDESVDKNTEFVWYENPKMTVEDQNRLYHVQVFVKR